MITRDCGDPFPSGVPSISYSPTSSSAPTIFSDCSCGAGEFKFELEIKTDQFPQTTTWRIEDENGVISGSETGYDYYGEQFTTFNHEFCLPVGCYDFVIDDRWGDGICCFSDYYDDEFYFDDWPLEIWGEIWGIEELDDFDGYYKGSVYGWKEVFNGGEFGFQAIEHFCGEDVCPFATHYPSSSPSASSPPSISSKPSPLPSASPQPSIINNGFYYYDDYFV